MKHLIYYTCVFTAFVALCAPAFAVDGVTLISQTSVQASGGFPYVINQRGSYRLSSDLAAQNTTAIQINVSNVSLDLNGFTVYCKNCSGVPGIWCSGANTSISNGLVGDFGGDPTNTQAYGIYFANFGGRAERVNAYANGAGIYADDGVTVTNSVIENNKIGVYAKGTLAITGSNIFRNTTLGILMRSGTVSGNTIDSNGLFPLAAYVPSGAIYTAETGTITYNSITNHSLPNSYALTNLIGAVVIYGFNSFSGNTNNAHLGTGLVSAGNNACTSPTSGAC